METEKFVLGECQGIEVKVLNVFFGRIFVEWPNGEREWVDEYVKWPIKEEKK